MFVFGQLVPNMSNSDVIERHYLQASERERLEVDVNRLERVRTEDLLERHLPRPPAVVRDVGGGPGHYAFHLSPQGYEVHLLDLVERHIRQARERNADSDGASIADARVGDARDLPWSEGTSDAVLLLGPLYHLQDAEDRKRALEEVWRVLRTGGVLFAAGISRFASTLEGLVHERLDDTTFAEIAAHDRKTGRHDNPTGDADYFTEAYFHRPEELKSEVAGVGFDVESLVGIEGPAWLLPDFNERWEDDEWRQRFLTIARELESEPSLVGASAHHLAIAQKPG